MFSPPNGKGYEGMEQESWEDIADRIMAFYVSRFSYPRISPWPVFPLSIVS